MDGGGDESWAWRRAEPSWSSWASNPEMSLKPPPRVQRSRAPTWTASDESSQAPNKTEPNSPARARLRAKTSLLSSWASLEPIPEPNRAEPEHSRGGVPRAQPSPEPSLSLASIRALSPRRAFELIRAEPRVEHRTDPRAELPIPALNKAELSAKHRV